MEYEIYDIEYKTNFGSPYLAIVSARNSKRGTEMLKSALEIELLKNQDRITNFLNFKVLRITDKKVKADKEMILHYEF